MSCDRRYGDVIMQVVYREEMQEMCCKSYRGSMRAHMDVHNVNTVPRVDKHTQCVMATSRTELSPPLCSHSQSHAAVHTQALPSCSALPYALLCVFVPLCTEHLLTIAQLRCGISELKSVFPTPGHFFPIYYQKCLINRFTLLLHWQLRTYKTARQLSTVCRE